MPSSPCALYACVGTHAHLRTRMIVSMYVQMRSCTHACSCLHIYLAPFKEPPNFSLSNQPGLLAHHHTFPCLALLSLLLLSSATAPFPTLHQLYGTYSQKT